MSAFIVDKTHIDLLVKYAADGEWCFSWRSSDDGEPLEWRKLDGMNLDETGQILVCENVQSVRARYPDIDSGGVAPGPCEEYWREPYTWSDPGYRLTPVEALKAIACYEYQSCEHDEWASSEAKRFCDALRMDAIDKLSGMSDAPWEWDADKLADYLSEAVTSRG